METENRQAGVARVLSLLIAFHSVLPVSAGADDEGRASSVYIHSIEAGEKQCHETQW